MYLVKKVFYGTVLCVLLNKSIAAGVLNGDFELRFRLKCLPNLIKILQKFTHLSFMPTIWCRHTLQNYCSVS